MQLRLDAAAGQVLLDHQRDLERDGIVELPQIQPRQLLDLLQPVHQRVAVDKQLAGGLGDVEVVLEEFVDCRQCFLIQSLKWIFFKSCSGNE